MLTYLICPSVQNVFIECFQKIRTCFKFKAQHVLVQRGPNWQIFCLTRSYLRVFFTVLPDLVITDLGVLLSIPDTVSLLNLFKSLLKKKL